MNENNEAAVETNDNPAEKWGKFMVAFALMTIAYIAVLFVLDAFSAVNGENQWSMIWPGSPLAIAFVVCLVMWAKAVHARITPDVVSVHNSESFERNQRLINPS